MSPFTADGFRVLLACLPPVAAGFLLLRRVAPAWAAFGGLVTGLAVLPAFRPSPAALGAAVARAIPLAVAVLLILYGGIAFSRCCGRRACTRCWAGGSRRRRPTGRGGGGGSPRA